MAIKLFILQISCCLFFSQLLLAESKDFDVSLDAGFTKIQYNRSQSGYPARQFSRDALKLGVNILLKQTPDISMGTGINLLLTQTGALNNSYSLVNANLLAFKYYPVDDFGLKMDFGVSRLFREYPAYGTFWGFGVLYRVSEIQIGVRTDNYTVDADDVVYPEAKYTDISTTSVFFSFDL